MIEGWPSRSLNMLQWQYVDLRWQALAAQKLRCEKVSMWTWCKSCEALDNSFVWNHTCAHASLAEWPTLEMISIDILIPKSLQWSPEILHIRIPVCGGKHWIGCRNIMTSWSTSKVTTCEWDGKIRDPISLPWLLHFPSDHGSWSSSWVESLI